MSRPGGLTVADTPEQLRGFVERRVLSGVSVVAEVVGLNGVVRYLAPTRSLQDYAREAGPLPGDDEPKDGEDN